MKFGFFDTAFRQIASQIDTSTYDWARETPVGRECYEWLMSILKVRRNNDDVIVHFNHDDIPVAVSWRYDDKKLFFPDVDTVQGDTK